MLVIDRSNSTSVHEQLLEQLRYRIASGHYQVEEMLPSTRELGKQLGISFHTVRKVYQALEGEGLLEARKGTGFVVKERTPLGKGERMERGAAVVQESLHRLIGLGLEEGEVEYLFQEQLSLLAGTDTPYKLIFTATAVEVAEQCAAHIKRHLQRPVEAVALRELARHREADYVFCTYGDIHRAAASLPRADVQGVVTYFRPDALERIARLIGEHTLAVITRHAEAVAPLMSDVRRATGFTGQMLGASVEDRTEHMHQVIQAADLVAYTPPCRRRLHSLLDETRPAVQLETLLGPESMEAIRALVPG